VLLSLLKFVIRTRFSKWVLLLIGAVVVYSLGISEITPPHTETLILGYYGTAIIAFFLAVTLATGGVMVFKSDRDYLFTLPLSPTDLSLSIFFSQFIVYGITILFTFGYIAQAVVSPLVIIDFVALSLTFTSLGIIAPALSTGVRLTLSVALALWTLLSLANFSFSPASAFNGNVYGGTATILALTAVTTVLAFRSLSRIELDMMRSLVRTTSTDVKSPQSYAGKSPLGAIYSMNLSTMSFAGRMNMAGTSRYVSRRVKTRWVVLATSAAAAAYLASVILRGPPTPFTVGTNTLPVAIIAAILLTFLAVFSSQSVIVNERIWLSLTSLPPVTYFRHLVASKLISFLLVLAPFAAADAELFALGYGEALGALAVVVFVIPGFFVIELIWSAYVAPIQVKGEDLTMAIQMNLRQLAAVLPLIPAFILAAAATLFPLAAVVGGAVLIAIAALLAMSNGFWMHVVVRLTENGFV
jgi:hypothetical protein